MKKILLALCFLAAVRTQAQIVNYSFENWGIDTFYLPAGAISNLPPDTISYLDPVGWTSSNTFSDLDSLGNQIQVTPDSTAEDGSLSIRMITEPIHIPVAIIGALHLVVPGFALNGRFNINPQTLLLSGGTQISPASVKGAGQPFSQRLADFKGYYNYAPVFNPHYNTDDSCLVWATLRKGGTIVANAIFKSATTTGGFQAFSAPFTYLNCEVPDTLVVLISSSLTTVSAILDTTTGLVPGSVLLIDNLSYDTLVGDIVPPTAILDRDSVHENRTDTLNVLANDSNCSGATLTVSIVTGPPHGTASISTNNEVIYTPNNGFGGWDSIYYKDTDPNNATSSNWLKIFVKTDAGINNVNEIALQVFPVPTSNDIHVRFQNPGKTMAMVYDMVGNVILSTPLNSDDNIINVSNLADGLYAIQLVNENNAVIARSKFTVSK